MPSLLLKLRSAKLQALFRKKPKESHKSAPRHKLKRSLSLPPESTLPNIPYIDAHLSQDDIDTPALAPSETVESMKKGGHGRYATMPEPLSIEGPQNSDPVQDAHPESNNLAIVSLPIASPEILPPSMSIPSPTVPVTELATATALVSSGRDRLLALQSDRILGKISEGPRRTKTEKKMDKLGTCFRF